MFFGKAPDSDKVESGMGGKFEGYLLGRASLNSKLFLNFKYFKNL
jgi:hypothetical protein